jgi:hypothetical protein
MSGNVAGVDTPRCPAVLGCRVCVCVCLPVLLSVVSTHCFFVCLCRVALVLVLVHVVSCALPVARAVRFVVPSDARWFRGLCVSARVATAALWPCLVCAASLSKDLRKKYNVRSVPIRKGDEVHGCLMQESVSVHIPPRFFRRPMSGRVYVFTLSANALNGVES